MDMIESGSVPQTLNPALAPEGLIQINAPRQWGY